MKSVRHIRLVAFTAALALSGTVGCAKQDAASAESAMIKIGVDIEMSGPAAVQGKAYSRAVKLVADRINADGGVQVGEEKKKIKLIIRDNKSDPAESLTVAKSLIHNDHVTAIVGGGSSPTTMSIVDTVERAKVPMVSMGSSTAIVTPIAHRQYIFKTPGNTNVVADVMMKTFTEKGLSRVSLLTVDNAYGDAGLKAWKNLQDQGKVKLVDTEKFTDQDKDYTVQISKMLAADPDVVVVWAIPPGAGIAAKNLKQAGFPAEKTFFDTGAGAELFIKGAGKAAEGMQMVHSPVLAGDEISAHDDLARGEKKFYDAYRKKYGSFSGFAPMAADALTAITNAITEAGKLDDAAIRDALENLSFHGVFGDYYFSRSYHGGVDESSLCLMKVEHGKWKPVKS
jgi:branched-chain amino acid transport system substrate-binding protein